MNRVDDCLFARLLVFAIVLESYYSLVISALLIACWYICVACLFICLLVWFVIVVRSLFICLAVCQLVCLLIGQAVFVFAS